MFSAWRRWWRARTLWERSTGLTRQEVNALIPGGAPWSSTYLIDVGRGDEVTARLAEAGVRLDQLDALREAAGRWFDDEV